MAAKKTVFVEAELIWAETQLIDWKAYIDDNPMNGLTDREGVRLTAKGGSMPYVIASIEQQGKFLQETMKNYLALLKEVDNMRSQEEAKKQTVRGTQELNMFESGELDD